MAEQVCIIPRPAGGLVLHVYSSLFLGAIIPLALLCVGRHLDECCASVCSGVMRVDVCAVKIRSASAKARLK
jgi:hypothetical protein